MTGDEIDISDVVGVTNFNSQYPITFLTTDTFSIDIDAGDFTSYSSGGYWVQVKQQYFTLSAQYAWHRFFAAAYGQFLRIVLTYNDPQMFQISTHRQNFELNAIKIWFRPGGRNIFGK